MLPIEGMGLNVTHLLVTSTQIAMVYKIQQLRKTGVLTNAFFFLLPAVFELKGKLFEPDTESLQYAMGINICTKQYCILKCPILN